MQSHVPLLYVSQVTEHFSHFDSFGTKPGEHASEHVVPYKNFPDEHALHVLTSPP